MFTTAPLFGKFHSPLKDAARPLRRRPLHHLASLCDQRIDPAFLAPNPSHTNSRQGLYFPKLTFLAFLDQSSIPTPPVVRRYAKSAPPTKSSPTPNGSIKTPVLTARLAPVGRWRN